MALIYDATLTPSKSEILQSWVPAQPWFDGGDITVVGAYRFDDPADEVGIETHLVRSGELVFQVPLTYRGAPLAGAESALITTLEHSVLGRRWVYNAPGDPVYAQTLATVIRTGGRQADLEFATPVPAAARVVTTHVCGSGSPSATALRVNAVFFADEGPTTVISAGGMTLEILRVVGAVQPADESDAVLGSQLTGTWPGQDEPVRLATLS